MCSETNEGTNATESQGVDAGAVLLLGTVPEGREVGVVQVRPVVDQPIRFGCETRVVCLRDDYVMLADGANCRLVGPGPLLSVESCGVDKLHAAIG